MALPFVIIDSLSDVVHCFIEYGVPYCLMPYTVLLTALYIIIKAGRLAHHSIANTCYIQWPLLTWHRFLATFTYLLKTFSPALEPSDTERREPYNVLNQYRTRVNWKAAHKLGVSYKSYQMVIESWD